MKREPTVIISKKTNFILIVFVLLYFSNPTTSFSQPAIQWQKCYGSTSLEYGNDIKQTSDGGYVFIGQTTNGNNGDVNGNHGQDFWVVKINATGNLQWQKCLGGSSFEIGYAIQQTTDGGYIVCGSTSSNDGDVTGLHDSISGGYGDAWVVKLDAIGDIQWQHCYGGSYGEVAYDIIQTTDGGYAFVGGAASNDYDVSGNHGGIVDVWLVKLNSIGTMQRQRCLGGTRNEFGYSVKQTTDGGFIFTGRTTSFDGDVTGFHTSLPPNVFNDVWVVKTDSVGNIQWQNCYGGSRAEIPTCIIQTNDGGYVITGSANSSDGDVSGYHFSPLYYEDAWVVKLNGSGILQWQHCYGGSDVDFFNSIEQTMDGGYILGGQTESMDGDVTGSHYADLWAVKIDSSGTIQWQKCLGGTNFEFGGVVRQTSDSGFIVLGRTYSNDGDVSGNHNTTGATSDCWVVKLGPDTILSFQNNEQEGFDFSVYPNPAHNYFHINYILPPNQSGNFILSNAMGSNVMEINLSSNTPSIRISTSNLSNGVYFWKVILIDKKFQTGKLVIVK